MLDGYDPKLSLLLPLQPPLQNFHSINGPPKGDLSKVIEAHITLAGYNIENGMGGECDVQLACIVDLIEQCQAEKSISSVVSLCIKRIALSPSKGILAPFFLRRLVSFDFLSAETKAIIFLEWGRFIKERAQHLKSLDLLCETIKIYEDLGIASLKLEKWQNAFDAFEKAHHNIPAQHPFLYELNYYKSLALKGLGRFKEAYEILARLVQEKHPHL